MKIYQTFVATYEDMKDTQVVDLIDTIKFKNKLWLVPKWIQKTGCVKPERIVRPLTDAFLPTDLNADYLLARSIPTTLLSGDLAPEEKDFYEVVEDPEICIRRTH